MTIEFNNTNEVLDKTKLRIVTKVTKVNKDINERRIVKGQWVKHQAFFKYRLVPLINGYEPHNT